MDEVRLGAKVALAAVIAEAHLHGVEFSSRQLHRAVAKTLRPEILRLIATPEDLPVLHHGPPRLAAVDGEFDLALQFGTGRGARGHVRGGINLPCHRARRHGQRECDAGRVECSGHDVRLRLWLRRSGGDDTPARRGEGDLRAVVGQAREHRGVELADGGEDEAGVGERLRGRVQAELVVLTALHEVGQVEAVAEFARVLPRPAVVHGHAHLRRRLAAQHESVAPPVLVNAPRGVVRRRRPDDVGRAESKRDVVRAFVHDALAVVAVGKVRAIG